jgi:hypothetical protein
MNSKFFKELPAYKFSVCRGDFNGILYHWEWDNTDNTEKIDIFLSKKGFNKANKQTNDTQMRDRRTRIEMYFTNPAIQCFSVQYIEGNGKMSEQLYYKNTFFSEKITIVTILSILGALGSVASIISLFKQ